MDKETIEKLKNIPKTKCNKCGRARYYTNPLEVCWECKNKFCFDHIHSGQVKKGMANNERVRDVCEVCKKIHKYHSI